MITKRKRPLVRQLVCRLLMKLILFLPILFVAVLPVRAQEVIDPRSGQLFLTATDLVLKAGPTNLEIRRSLDAGRHKPSLLGTGWRLNWESRLSRDGPSVLIDEGAGTVKFDPDGNAGYKTASGDRIIFEKDGRAIRTKPDSIREVFDAQGRLVERDYRNGNKVALHYDSEGRLVKIDGPFGTYFRFTTDKEGRVTFVESSITETVRYAYSKGELSEVKVGSKPPTRYSYDTNMQLISIEEPLSGIVQFVYDSKGRITRRRWADGSNDRYEYDESSNRLLYTSASGGVTKIQWSQDRRHEEAIDPLGRKTVTEYDEAGRPVSVTGPTGASARITYDGLGRTVAVTNPIGQATRLEYVGERSLVKTITQPDGGKQVFEYDSHGNLLSLKVGTETVMVYTYYPDGNIATVMGQGRLEEKSTYHPNGRIKSVANALGETTQYDYDSRGNLIRETNPLGGVTVRSYDDQGRMVSMADQTGVTTRYKYDDKGRLSQVIDPAGGVTRYEYDARGRQVAETNPANQEIRYQYDGAGRLLKTTWPDKTTDTREYDAAGNLIKLTDRQGRTTQFEYDPFGRLWRERKPEGLEITYRYDGLSNLAALEDSAGTKREFQRDASGRLTAEIDPSGAITRYQYDPSGNVASRTDPNNRVKLFSYDREGILTRVQEPSGDTASYEYDPAGRPVALHHPSGGVTRLSYDAMGNLVTLSDPLGNQNRWSYDLAGRLSSSSDAAGRVIRFTYDQAGRLKEKQLPDGGKVKYEYDLLGNLTLADDGKFPVRFSYDQAGRLTKKEYPAIKKSVAYQYDQHGFRTKLISGGSETRYEYNVAKQVSAIILPAGERIDLTYHAGGQLESIRYPNAVTGHWEYDNTGRIAKISYHDKQGKPVSGWTYRYDPAGNPVEFQDGQGQTYRFEYDPVDQLTKEASAGKTIRYQYLPGGNRASVEEEGKVIQYRYDAADRLVRAGDDELTYDANGNLISRKGPRGTTSYEYDAENRLVKAVSPDGKSTTFGYAPTGERVWRRDQQGLTYYLYNGLDLVQEVGEDGKVKGAYFHGPGIDRPLVLVLNGKSYYYHPDRLGSISVMTDDQGKVAVSYSYDAFGRIKAQESKVANPFTFTGREFDPATGLYYYRARYYDPSLGRFLSTDPAEPTLDNPLKLNPYLYAQNNPVRYVDPLGLDASFVEQYYPVSGFEGNNTDYLLGLRQHMRNILAGRAPIPPTARPEYMDNTKGALNNIEEALRRRGALPTANPNSTQPIARPPAPGGGAGSPGTGVGGRTLQGARPGSPVPEGGVKPSGTGDRVGPRGAGVLTLVMTAAQLINCYQEGLSPTQCATRMAGQALVGALSAAGMTAVAILTPAGAVALTAAMVGYSAGVGAVNIYEGMGELNKDWDQWKQRQADAEARKKQEDKNFENLDGLVKDWQNKFDDEIAKLRAQIAGAQAGARGAAQSGANASTAASNLLSQLQGLQSQLEQVSAVCDNAAQVGSLIGSDAANAIKNADLVQKGLDLARAKVDGCKSKQDANDAIDIYNAAKPLIAAAASSYRKANEGNDQLKKVLAQAEAAKSLRSQASGLVNRIKAESASARGFVDTTTAEARRAEGLLGTLKSRKKEMLAQVWKIQDSFILHREEAYQKLVPLMKHLEEEEPALTAGGSINSANYEAKRAGNSESQADEILSSLNSLPLCEGIASQDGAVDQAAQAVSLMGMVAGDDIPGKAAACLASLTPPPSQARTLISFTVSCSPSVVEAGNPSTCTASGTYSDDSTKVFDLTGSPTNWESGPTIKTQGLKPGSYLVKASREGMNSTAILTVKEPYDVGKDPGMPGGSKPGTGKAGEKFEGGAPPPPGTSGARTGGPQPGLETPPEGPSESGTAGQKPPQGVECYSEKTKTYYRVAYAPCPPPSWDPPPDAPTWQGQTGKLPPKVKEEPTVKTGEPPSGKPMGQDPRCKKGEHWHEDTKMCCAKKH